MDWSAHRIPSVTGFDAALLSRFFDKTESSGPRLIWLWTGDDYEQVETECLLWTGAKNQSNYGRFWEGRIRCWTAHCFAYVAANGDIPTGHQVDHLCRTPNCVRDDHLEAVTEDENTRRQWLIYHRLTPTCPAGHAWTPENTGKDGESRRCNQCNRDRVAAWSIGPRDLADLSPTCRNGHDRATNLRFNKRGGVVCKQCQRDAKARHDARKLFTVPRDGSLPSRAMCREAIRPN